MGDFGLTGKSGGTSIFMAPEGLSKDSRIVGKTDLYSFAVTVLFLSFPAELAIKLLFFPISENLEIFIENLSCAPLLRWIFKSLQSDPEKRINFENWKSLFRLRMNYKTEIDSSHLDRALEKEGGLHYYIRNYFGQDIRLSQVNENEAYNLSTAISQIQNLSLLESKVELGVISKGNIKLQNKKIIILF